MYRQYERLRVLGRGVHGAAVLLRHPRTGEMVVSKELSLSRFAAAELADVQNEVRILASLTHPHIIAYRCSYPIDEQQLFCIVRCRPSLALPKPNLCTPASSPMSHHANVYPSVKLSAHACRS